MKILVTVGSGRFDQLIEAADKQLSCDAHEVLCQVAKGGYCPENHPSVEFVESFSDYWKMADIVITHAGAATVFELLEASKKLVVVPNLNRVDSHQMDLAQFLEQQQLAMVCTDLTTLSQRVIECASSSFKPYIKEPFFMAESVLNYFEIPLL